MTIRLPVLSMTAIGLLGSAIHDPSEGPGRWRRDWFSDRRKAAAESPSSGLSEEVDGRRRTERVRAMD